MRPVLLHHADAEVDRALAIAIPTALFAVFLFSVCLMAIAPRNPTRRRRAAAIAFLLAGLGAAFVALLTIPWFTEEEATFAWWILALAVAAGFLLAPVPAFVAFFREEGRLAGAAIGLSLVLPALFIAWMVACGITDACFH
jgi:hypothetical protein